MKGLSRVLKYEVSGCNIHGQHEPHSTCPGLDELSYLLASARNTQRFARARFQEYRRLAS
jgi:hypothetical protein